MLNWGRLFLSTVLPMGCVMLCASTRLQAQPVDSEILTYRGPDRSQRLLEGASKEGEVVFYSAMITNQALRPMADAFQKKYPKIKMTFWRADSEDIAAKLSAEMRANSLKADAAEGTGIGEIAVQAGFAQPVWSPELASLPPKIRDSRGLWAPTRMSYFSAAYNTKLISSADAPKTYEDLLDPRWKGKIAWPFVAASAAPLFVTNLRIAWGEDRAMDYFRKLSQQKILNFGAGNARTLVDRVIAGEYPIALAIFAHHPMISADKGAPVTSQLMGPVASAAGTLVVPKGARHPHAAALLLDFILSKEGQQILAGAEYFPVRPDVEPLAKLAKVKPDRAGYEENFISPEDLNKYTEGSIKMLEEMFR
jgi:ABC-type Fe3+ transport system substrate-binding protein